MNVLLIDDHALIRISLKMLVLELYPASTIFQAATFPDGLLVFESNQIDLVILDIEIPGSQHLKMLEILRNLQPKVSILIHTVHDENLYGLTYIRAGSDGFLSKNATPENIKVAIQTVMEKGKYINGEAIWEPIDQVHPPKQGSNALSALSPSELRVTQLIIEGKWNKEIAAIMGVNISTINTYKRRIYNKLDVSDAIQLAKKVNMLKD
jgi:DNA-binding NarL/FixJ family response regulator